MLRVTVLLLVFCHMESSAGRSSALQCPPQWLLFGRRCFAFFPVWSSWTTASSLCSQSSGSLVSLHTSEERKSVQQLVDSSTPVWVGGYQEQQTGSWIWSDESPFSEWTNQVEAESGEGGACLEMTTESGELKSAPCGELRFYICSTPARFQTLVPDRNKPAGPGVRPGLSLFDVLWDSSFELADEIFLSSSLIRGFRSGQLKESCYSEFIQQEALYLHRVSSTLEVLIGGLREAGDVRSLLLETFRQYSHKNQNISPSPPPQWLQFSLQSFHSVVLEDPVYWLVALSARACLQNYLTQKMMSDLGPKILDSRVNSLFQRWWNETVEASWLKRYQQVLQGAQDQMDVYKAINIFRLHMMNESRLHRTVTCEDEEDDEGGPGRADSL